jgi:orotidine-5'-phosphate decarboxylase
MSRYDPKTAPPAERLILALDVPDGQSARTLVTELGDAVRFYKIGLELAMSGEYFELLDWLLARDKRVFADLKFYDVPATVAAAVRQVRNRGATFLTVHGDRAIMEAAAAEKGDALHVLAVTVLTSLDKADLEQMGIHDDVRNVVVNRAQLAIASGCDGVIASGHEAGELRATLGAVPLIVTPGIRPADNTSQDDQKRIVTPAAAIRDGADYLVVGRPIRGASQPRAAAEAIQAEIASALAD